MLAKGYACLRAGIMIQSERDLGAFLTREAIMTQIITGLFENPQDAAVAVHTLEASGIPAQDISIMASESFDKESFAVDSHSKLPEGVAIGASSGGAIGALAAGLTAVGTVATPQGS